MPEMILDQVLESYMKRVEVRVGNGLSRGMNRHLRSYPAIPEIIKRTAAWLCRAEKTFQFSGVAVRTMHLYWDLIKEHEDWGAEIPVVRRLTPAETRVVTDQFDEADLEEIEMADHPSFAGTVEFRLEPRLPYNQFAAAMTIGRRIGLLGGHGRIVLDPQVRKALKNAHAATVAAGEMAS